MRWLYKSAVLTAGRFGPPAVIYLAGAAHYKTEFAASYALAVNAGQIVGQLSECGLSARVARVGSAYSPACRVALLSRLSLLVAISAVALAVGWMSFVDAPIAFGTLMLIVARDTAIIEREVRLLSIDAACGMSCLITFFLPLTKHTFLGTVALLYLATGGLFVLALFGRRVAANGPPPTDDAARYRSDWSSYVNRLIGLFVTAFDLQVIVRVGLGDEALTRYVAAKSIFRAGGVAVAFAQAFIGARLDVIRGMARPQTVLLWILALVLAGQLLVLLFAYDPRQALIHLVVAFTLSAVWALVYSVYTPAFMKYAMNEVILLAALVSNLIGFATMLVACRQYGIVGVAFGFAIQSFLFCQMVVRSANQRIHAEELEP